MTDDLAPRNGWNRYEYAVLDKLKELNEGQQKLRESIAGLREDKAAESVKVEAARALAAANALKLERVQNEIDDARRIAKEAAGQTTGSHARSGGIAGVVGGVAISTIYGIIELVKALKP